MTKLFSELIQSSRNPDLYPKITELQFNEWQEHMILDLICGKTVGQSFAEYFDVSDLFLMFGRPTDAQVQEHLNAYYRTSGQDDFIL